MSPRGVGDATSSTPPHRRWRHTLLSASHLVGAARVALRDSFRVDLTLVAPIVGAITTAPVVAIFVVGLILGGARQAVPLALGALLIGIISLVGAPRLSIHLATLSALTIATSVFVGVLTGAVPWLHTLLLLPWCFAAGLLVAIGQTQAAIGTQAVVAYLILGRFAGSISDAWHLASLVLFGALVEIVALLVLRLPPSLGYQRTRLAAAFDALAQLAGAQPEGSALAALAALDEAQRAIAAPSLFGRTDVRDLRAVFDQARRMRLELTTLSGLRLRLAGHVTVAQAQLLEESFANVAAVFEAIGEGLRQSEYPAQWRGGASRLRTVVDKLAEQSDGEHSPVDVLLHQCVTHLNSIGGQLRSAANLVDNARNLDGRRVWRAPRPTLATPDFVSWRNTLSTLRSTLRLDSPARRHAIRLTVAVPLSSLLATLLHLPRGYWLPFAVAVILKPNYSSLLHYGVGRLVGTIFGATFAALVVSGLHPNLVLTTLLVALCAWVACAFWDVSFSVSIAFVTALILILLNTSLHAPVRTALDRFIETSLGGVIALGTYLLWPTSARAGVTQALSDLFAALSSYVDAVLGLVVQQPIDASATLALSRTTRLAWGEAESAVGRSVEEPRSTRIDPVEGRGLLSATMRILRVSHALRTEAERGVTAAPSPEFDALALACRTRLRELSESFHVAQHPEWPGLRPTYESAARALALSGSPDSIALHLDELVNAINTAAHLATSFVPSAAANPQ